MKPLTILVVLAVIITSCHDQAGTSHQQPNDTLRAGTSTVAVESNSAEPANGGFLKFWQQFRTAVLNFDTTQIMELTEFPFQTRGPDDSDPTIDYNKKKFVRVFKAFLNQATGQVTDDSTKSFTYITELDYIKRTETPDKKDILPDQARIGNLWFTKAGKNWKLAFAYLEYDTIDSLKK